MWQQKAQSTMGKARNHMMRKGAGMRTGKTFCMTNETGKNIPRNRTRTIRPTSTTSSTWLWNFQTRWEEKILRAKLCDKFSSTEHRFIILDFCKMAAICGPLWHRSNKHCSGLELLQMKPFIASLMPHRGKWSNNTWMLWPLSFEVSFSTNSQPTIQQHTHQPRRKDRKPKSSPWWQARWLGVFFFLSMMALLCRWQTDKEYANQFINSILPKQELSRPCVHCKHKPGRNMFEGSGAVRSMCWNALCSPRLSNEDRAKPNAMRSCHPEHQSSEEKTLIPFRMMSSFLSFLILLVVVINDWMSTGTSASWVSCHI